MYGYDMIKMLLKYFPDTEESTFYAILRRMNREHWTDMYYNDVSNGPKRKYYKILERGEQVFDEYVKSLHEIIVFAKQSCSILMMRTWTVYIKKCVNDTANLCRNLLPAGIE